MSIHCRLSVLMGENKCRIQDIHQKTGLARTTISNLYHDKMERIDYETLNKLCEFFECRVDDILEHRNDR